jgi:hypothetical protein
MKTAHLSEWKSACAIGTDHASRFLRLCEALESAREDTACTAFERLFRERGLPFAIRSDRGVPFASPNALFNLSKLSGLPELSWRPRHPADLYACAVFLLMAISMRTLTFVSGQ